MSTPSAAPVHMLVFRYPKDAPEFSAEQQQQILTQWRAWMSDLKGKGLLVAGDPLTTEPASVVHGPQGHAATDGPFIEAKEIVAGYIMVAADFVTAVAIAKNCPALEWPGRTVEVRQLAPMDGRFHQI